MTLKGSCHCGAIRFELATPPREVVRCNCSICAKRGALWAYYSADQVRLSVDPDQLASYRWGEALMTFHHCSRCGCSTHNEGPEWGDGAPDPVRRRVTVNARLLDDFDLDAAAVREVDGRNLR